MGAESYKAFLSYSHSGDEPLAAALQTALQRLGKPWYRRQACKVFRDQTSLEASPALWPALERRLASSEFLILIASPEAARSAWVRREIQWWLANRSSETLLFVLAGGEIVWDDVSKDFDWPRTTALPTELVGRFKSVPFYVDMRWARGIGHLTLEQVRFRSEALTLSAALHGVAKDEIESEEIRQHRRVRRVIWTAGTVMAALTIVSVYASARVVGVRQGQRELALVRVAVARCAGNRDDAAR